MAGKEGQGIMDLQILMPWIAAALSISSLLSNIYTVFTSPSRKNAADVAKLYSDLAKHDRRIQSLEGEIKHLPDRDSTHRMELAMEKINGRLDTLNETLKPIKATNERLNELLVEQAKK